MEETREFTVPPKTKVDGWYEIPMWLMNANAIPYPKHKYTLPSGVVVEPGQTIELVGGELRVKSPPLP